MITHITFFDKASKSQNFVLSFPGDFRPKVGEEVVHSDGGANHNYKVRRAFWSTQANGDHGSAIYVAECEKK